MLQVFKVTSYLLAPEECDDSDEISGDSQEDEDDATGRGEMQQGSWVALEKLFARVLSDSIVGSWYSESVIVSRC